MTSEQNNIPPNAPSHTPSNTSYNTVQHPYNRLLLLACLHVLRLPSLACYHCSGCIMTSDQIEGNEPLHENWGADTGDAIDEGRYIYPLHSIYHPLAPPPPYISPLDLSPNPIPIPIYHPLTCPSTYP